MRVFLSAGEASGDTYAAALVEDMRRLSRFDKSDRVDQSGDVTPTFEGIGGKRLAATGATMIADSSGWGAISVAQALRVAFKALPGYYKAKGALAKGKPGLFVPIDFGYANIRLAKHAKRRGWKVLYFMPPGSWRRDKQGKDLPSIADEIVTPFQWSAEIFEAMGARAHWFGHPIKQIMRTSHSSPQERDPKRVAVLPGSRIHEVELNLPVIANALKDWPGIAEFAVASSIDLAELQRSWRSVAKGRSDDVFTAGDIYGVFGRSQAAIVCSGTATLEAALCRCPMVVIYRLTPGMVAEARLLGLRRPKYISLPNILLQRDAVPELVHTELTPEAVRSRLEALLQAGEARGEQLKAFAEIEQLLGPDDAITRTAQLALSLL